MSAAPATRGEPAFVVLADAAAVAQAVAERMVEAARAGAAARGRADLVTTGGSMPMAIYRALLRPPLRDRMPWDALHVWFGDDRYVPRDHPASNAGLLDDAFFGTAGREAVPAGPLHPDHVHPFPTGPAIGEGRGAAWCAERYAADIRDSVPLGADGWPRFELILVGIGPDGHLLSVFPGSEAFERDDLALAIPAPTHVEPHLARVTLNPRVLAGSPVLAALAGPDKAAIVGTIFGTEIDARRWPAQSIVRPGATWVLDRAAAAHLERPAAAAEESSAGA